MEYTLTAEVIPPVNTPALDALQRHGVAALLDEHLEMLAEIEGPDGVEIEPVDHRISVEPDGASVTWVLDAPALAFAEEAARHVLGELLERTELLAEWSVRRCEVTASDEDLAAALAGVDDDDDTETGDVEIEIDLDELGELSTLVIGAPTEADREAKRDQLLDASESLGAFPLEAFGYDAEDTEDDAIDLDAANLVAGALVQGLELLTEELFVDIQTLEEAGTPASEQEVLWVLHDLPTRYAGHYTALFAKKFLITTAVLGYRLALPEWDGPLNTAEILAIQLMKTAARNQLELAGVADELPLDEMFETFDEYAFEDLDVEGLFAAFEADADADEDEDDIDELVLVEWFEPHAEADDEDDDDDSDGDDEDGDEDGDGDPADVTTSIDQTVQA